MVVKSLEWPSDVASPGMVLEEFYFHSFLFVNEKYGCLH